MGGATALGGGAGGFMPLGDTGGAPGGAARARGIAAVNGADATDGRGGAEDRGAAEGRGAAEDRGAAEGDPRSATGGASGIAAEAWAGVEAWAGAEAWAGVDAGETAACAADRWTPNAPMPLPEPARLRPDVPVIEDVPDAPPALSAVSRGSASPPDTGIGAVMASCCA